jgi:hypothetical protein
MPFHHCARACFSFYFDTNMTQPNPVFSPDTRRLLSCVLNQYNSFCDQNESFSIFLGQTLTMSDVVLPKRDCAIRPPHDCDSNIIHWGAATTRYGSLPLRRRDDGSNDGDSTVSSLSSDGDSRIDKNSISIPPPKHQQLLLVAMIALPLFMAMVLLHDFIQQQTVATTHKSPSSSSSLTYKSISMYGRVKADNLSDEQDWKGDNDCNANQFQCTACNGKWCATDAPPSFITAVPTTNTAEVGSVSAGYCIW